MLEQSKGDENGLSDRFVEFDVQYIQSWTTYLASSGVLLRRTKIVGRKLFLFFYKFQGRMGANSNGFGH